MSREGIDAAKAIVRIQKATNVVAVPNCRKEHTHTTQVYGVPIPLCACWVPLQQPFVSGPSLEKKHVHGLHVHMSQPQAVSRLTFCLSV